MLDTLELTAFDPGGDPLLAGGFVYGMVVQHEHQHDETLLATLQLMDDYAHPAADGDGTPACRSRRGGTRAGRAGPGR